MQRQRQQRLVLVPTEWLQRLRRRNSRYAYFIGPQHKRHHWSHETKAQLVECLSVCCKVTHTAKLYVVNLNCTFNFYLMVTKSARLFYLFISATFGHTLLPCVRGSVVAITLHSVRYWFSCCTAVLTRRNVSASRCSKTILINYVTRMVGIL